MLKFEDEIGNFASGLKVRPARSKKITAEIYMENTLTNNKY